MEGWFCYIAKAVVRSGFAVATRWQVTGRENVPDEGPLLIVSNHLNLADPPLLSASIDRHTRFMAKEELFRSALQARVLSSLGGFPVHRNQADTKAVRQSLRILGDGLALVMFPESSRSPNAQLQPAFSGAALIALRSGAPILPVGISGTEKMKGKTWPFRRPRVTVRFGRPFYPPPGSKPTKAELARLTDLIMGRIAELLPEEYRGRYLKQNPVPSPLRNV